MNGDFISVGEALKFLPPFKGDRQDVLAFVGNVDTAFALINPSQESISYKFVLTRISGEPITVISHRNHEIWAELKRVFAKYLHRKTKLLLPCESAF